MNTNLFPDLDSPYVFFSLPLFVNIRVYSWLKSHFLKSKECSALTVPVPRNLKLHVHWRGQSADGQNQSIDTCRFALRLKKDDSANLSLRLDCAPLFERDRFVIFESPP